MENQELKPKVLVSACLLGENVRFNGGHLNHPWIDNQLSKHVDFIRVCPEVMAGMGTPRASIRLVNDGGVIKAIEPKSNKDWSDQLEKVSRDFLSQIKDIHGFIGAGKSPSCGLERVKVYPKEGMPEKNGVGVFSKIFMEKLNDVPYIDSGRLHNPVECEWFIRQILALFEFDLLEKKISYIQKFHQRYKYVLMEYDQLALKELGALVGNSNKRPVEEVFQTYRKTLLESLRKRPNKGTRINVMYHIIGYFKNQLATEERKEFEMAIEDYQNSIVPYIVPLRLLRLFCEKFDNAYLKEQAYLNPYPQDLRLLKAL
jgi:uncharacterized protein YbgA (DUF1722 family)/uncharacterized protein YbbK (DUF523 family)